MSGYFSTDDDRQREMERFFANREPGTPTVALGDFNDGEDSGVIRRLEARGMINALPQFDRYAATWKWRTSTVTLRRRLDHILYSPELYCRSARVIPAGASDHFPVEAVLSKASDSN